VKRKALEAMGILILACLAASATAPADDRKIIWRIVTLWTVIGGSPGLPTRYEGGNGDFATKSQCLEELKRSRDRLEADRADAERKARRAGAIDVEYRAINECAPRYADGASPP